MTDEKHRWHKVEDGLPTQNGAYAVCNEWDFTLATWIDEDWHRDGSILSARHYTHYIKLPPLPFDFTGTPIEPPQKEKKPQP